ncbi:MAG TPA: hypothetical protein VG898_11410 [Solirubrobacterales bacterium]|nr:hypothetical protein [Solirubrobacterales bacterium]
MLKRHWSILALGCAIVASTLLLLYLVRGLTPLVDEWGYLYGYRSWSLETLLTPHNGHLMLLSLLLYKGMFALFGLESQVPYQLVNLAFSAAVATLLFSLIRSAIGDLLALAAAVLILFYGAGADVILPTFAYPNLFGLATGLAVLLVLRRGDRKGDVAACLLLTISITAYSLGIVFAVGAVAALALRPRGERLRSWWVVAVPILVYAAWAIWATKFHQQHLYVHNLKIIGSAIADQASAVMAGLTGLYTTPNGPKPPENLIPIRTTWGPVLVGGLAVLAYWRLRRPPRLSNDAIVAIVVLVVYFFLVGISLNQFRNTFDTRFVYVGSVFMLLAVAELLAPYRPARGGLIAIGVVFVFSMCANIAELGDVAQSFRAQSSSIRAKLAAVALAGPAAKESVTVEDPPGAANFSVEQFHEFDADFGLPAYSRQELESSAPGARQIADEELVRVLGIAPEPVRSVAPSADAGPLEVGVREGQPRARRRGKCALIVSRGGATTNALIQLESGGVAYRSSAPVETAIGKFGDMASALLPKSTGANRILIRGPSSLAPWTLAMNVSAPTLVCPVTG